MVLDSPTPTAVTQASVDYPHVKGLSVPTRGVLVLTGYGLRIAVERGHLAVSDGVGPNRRSGLLSRATCGLTRLVVIGHFGTVSLEALRWIADLGAAFVQLDADGVVVACFAPLGSDDPRLRRAQALAGSTEVGLTLSRELLREKLESQAAMLTRLPNGAAARPGIDRALMALEEATTPEALRRAEADGALAYWGAWSTVPTRFARPDAAKVPVNWRTFGTRSSPITKQPRLAANPANALLNYAYAILETEVRIACLTVGFDPGLGLLHADQRSRDSLALDLMEPLRLKVDALVLDLLERRTLLAKDLFETPQGNCRLMPALTAPLAEHAPQFARWAAPLVERLARQLLPSAQSTKPARLATPLTGDQRSAGRDGIRIGERAIAPALVLPLPNACKACGVILEQADRVWCTDCQAAERITKDRDNIARSFATLAEARAAGQDPAHGNDAARKRAETHLEQQRLNREWQAGNEATTTEAEYRERILPELASVSVKTIAWALGVSEGYAGQIRKGEKLPHPRHWKALAKYVTETL